MYSVYSVAKTSSMEPDVDLREQVHKVYDQVAIDPGAKHPFRVGRELAGRAEYPQEWLSTVPAASVDSFAGVACLPFVAEVPPDAALLDLGCGGGLDSLLMARKVRSVVGIDFSAEMLARAQQSADAMAVGNVEFRLGDAERIPAEPSAFDAALVNGIFNLNPARAEIFAELARVIKPGGVLWAAELILKGPLPPDVKPSREDWFS